MQDNAQILGFTAGELSPWLTTRYDLQAYQRGASRLENFLVQPYGGLRRRRGTQLVAHAAEKQAEGVRLVPFCFSESDVLMLEFYPGGMHVYRDGELLKKDGEPYELATPWSTPEMVSSLRFMQVNDIVYVTSANYEPTMLMRRGDTDWSYEPMRLHPYPRETYMQQDIGLKVTTSALGYNALLELDSGSYFTPDMVNNEYVIADMPVESKTYFLNETMTISGSTAAPNLSSSSVKEGAVIYVANKTTGMNEFYTCIRAYTSSAYNGSSHPRDYPHYFAPGYMRLSADGTPYEVCGEWELRTTGEWDGMWELWRTYDSLRTSAFFRLWNWTCIKTFGQDAYHTRQNWAFTGSEDVPCRMVLVCRACKGTSTGAIMYFRSMGGTREVTFNIAQVNSSTQAVARIMAEYTNRVTSFYTKRWSFGAFGARNGYPRFAGLHQGRFWLGGADGLPTTLLGSTVNDYANFRVSSADDASLHLTMATDDQSRICWICPMRNLLVGTSESEWTLSSPDGGCLTPTSANFSRQSAVGSENKVAYGVENTVFYVQRGGKRLREISYKLEADGYTSTDASILAEHLFNAGVKEWVVQRGNCFHVWALMNDGSLAVLTTNPEQQVAAWQRAAFPNRRVLGMAAITRVGSSEDEVWFVVQNDLNHHVSIERICEDNDYIDGCCELQPDASGRFSAGPHLAGLAGLVYPKGDPRAAQRVQFDAEGCCELPGAAPDTTYCVGAEFASELHTMPLEKEGSFNTVQQIGRMKLRLIESSPAFSYKSLGAARWEYYDPARDQLAAPYTGAIRISQIPSPGVGRGICLRADGAQDFALTSLTVEIDFHGR